MQVGSLSENRNLLLVLWMIVALGLGVVFYIYYHQPAAVRVQELETIVEKKKREVREIEMTKRLLAEVRQEIERLKIDIARIEKFFPEEVFIPRVLVLIENLAEATHIRIESIKPEAGGRGGRPAAGASSVAPRPAPSAAATEKQAAALFDESKEYKTMTVDFRALGSFHNVYNFMNELSTFPKLVVVDRLSLNAKDTKGESSGDEREREIEVGGYVELTVEMPLTFYVQKQKSLEFSSAAGETAAGE